MIVKTSLLLVVACVIEIYATSVEGSDVYTNLNSTTTLVCPFKADSSQNIIWNGPPDSETLSIGSDVNPSLPIEHKSRLSVTGNPTIGEYNLRITNIQQSDESQYRCTGISGGLSTFADLNLFILEAPSSYPVISTDPTGNIIAGSNVKLICTILGGKPLASISWVCPGSGQAESGTDLSAAISTVQFVVNKTDNGKTCQCIGSHSLWTQNMTANIKLDIKYAPNNSLSITQIPDGGILIDNQKDVKLTCTVTGGYPLAILHWDCDGIKTNESTENTASYSVTFVVNKLYNNRICTCSATHIVPSYRPSVGHTLIVFFKPENDPIIIQNPPGYVIVSTSTRLTCEVSGGNPLAILSWNCTGTSTNNTSGNQASYSVQLDIDRNFNNMICACSATHMDMSYRPIVRHVLLVAYTPDNNPVVKQDPEGGVIAGEKVTLHCTVSGGNPLATLTWDCQGRKMNNTIGTTASYSVEIITDKNYNNRICTCSASHFIQSYKPQTQHRLIVFYVPAGNLIVKQMPEDSIIIHHKVTLVCTIAGGNPLAILSWNCTGTFTNSTISNISSYSVEFIVKQNDNNRFCTCTATHMIPSYRKQVHHQLVVYYGPVNVPSIRQNPKGGIINGNSVTLTCEVSGGNPLVTLMWNCSGPTLNNTAGNKASYSVVISVDKQDNKKICACSTMHPDPSYEHTIQHVLDVLFGPDSPRLIPNPMMPWFEGNITSMKCIYEEGNPVSTIEWKRENNVQSVESNPILDLGMVSKDDLNSSIICVVSNKYGTVESEVVYLDIEYYPRIEIGNEKLLKNEGENLTVSCSATGNPLPSVSWSEYSNDFKNATISESVLLIEDIDRHHDGTFTCKAKSKSKKYGNLVTEKEILVVVNFAPDVTVSKDLSQISENEVLTLTCKANGKPTDYTYGWRHTFEGKYIRTLPSVTETLILTNLSYQDIGRYECFVNNGIQNRNGTLNQTNNTAVELQFTPVFVLSDEVTTGKSGNNVTSAVEFISYPDIRKPVLWRNATNNSILVNSSSMLMILERQNVKAMLYGVSVYFDKYGYRSVLHFPNFEEKQDGFYNLMINNSVGVNDISIRVVLSDRPKPPEHFSARVIGSTEVTLTWIGGFNGGNNQTFILTYWKKHSMDIKVIMVSEHNEKDYEVVISDLSPSTNYIFQINATNSEGYSESVNNTIVLSTIDISESESSIVGTVGAAVGGIAAAALIITPIVIFLRKRQASAAKKIDRKNLTLTSTEEDEEPGLKDNVLYESAGENFIANPGQIGDVYAEVKKSNVNKKDNGQIQETALYAEIKKDTVHSNNGETYATARSNTKGKPNKKGKPKSKKERADDVYENIGEQNTTVTAENRNKDGLIYADLVFKDDGKRKFIIRGLENKTNYADIDLDLKADPIPSDESDTEENKTDTKEK